MMRVLDLFSGIGGFSLGLERAGMRTVAFCEIDPYCRRVLAKHWPDVPVFGDIRELTAASLVANPDYQRQLQPEGREQDKRGRIGNCGVEVICGGFPCQDISVAGKGAGIKGERSGLWSEYARIIGEVRPRYVIVENVAALLGRGLDVVLGDLAALGFDAEWHCIPASAVGAPHRRDRLWIVAYPNDERAELPVRHVGEAGAQRGHLPSGCSADLADANESRLERWLSQSLRECAHEWATGEDGSHPEDNAKNGEGARRGVSAREWRIEPDVGRVAHGVPARVDRLRSLGNAVVPQIPEMIGRAILEAAE